MRTSAALLFALALVGFGCKAKPSLLTRGAAPAQLAVDEARDASAPAAKQSAPSLPASAAPAASAPLLAYSYSFAFELPAGRILGLMARHEQACASAGPSLCQVTGSSRSNDADSVSGSLQIRAAPAWLARFRAGLDGDARAAGGKLVQAEVSTEDLTRSIVDTEAALRAKTTLRDRLQALLAQHPGKMSDLLEIERELATVQGELDAAQSELAVMRGRVDMSAAALNYRSEGRPVTARTAEPLKAAFNNFFRVFAATLAVLVYLVAIALPLGLVAVPIVWLIVRYRRRRARRATPSSPTA